MTPARGFTVLEAVTASAATAVVLIAATSLISLSARAGPEAEAQANAIRDARAWRLMADDLSMATSIVNLTETEVQFEVADRDGDKVTDVVRYWWPGAGSGLYRQVNGSADSELSNALSSLSLSGTWVSRTVTSTGATALSSSGTRIAGRAIGASVNDYFTLANTTPLALTIKPRLPEGATHWKVESLTVVTGKIGGSVSDFTATLRLDTLAAPFAGTASVTSAAASSTQSGSRYYVTFKFSGAPEIASTQTATFDLRSASGSSSVKVYGITTGAADSRQWYHTGSGAVTPTATEQVDACPGFQVNGWVRSPTTSSATVQRLARVAITAKKPTGENVMFGIRTIGEPEVK